MTDRNYFDRMAGERKVFQARMKKGGFGLLWDEFLAHGWRARKVDARTGERLGYGRKGGVWVMRYCGFDGDEPLKFAARVEGCVVRCRAMARGEKV